MPPQPYPPPNDSPLPPPFPPPPSSSGDDDSKWTKKHDYTFGGQSISDSGFNPTFTTITPTITPWPNPSSFSVAEAASTKSEWRPRYTGGWDGPPPPGGSHNMSSAVMGAIGAIGTLAIICLMGGCCLFMCRRGRKRRENSPDRQVLVPQQMIKTNGQSAVPADTRAYAAPSTVASAPALSSPSTVSAPSTLHNAQPPVLLSTNIDRSYYTGIDTSDAISLVDNQRSSINDLGDAGSISEPPPPYRPNSIPSVSRENSCRMSARPPSYRPRLSMLNTSDVIRSPFDDPEGDSPISDLGDSAAHRRAGTRDMEEMSDVSEIDDYQHEPLQARTTL